MVTMIMVHLPIEWVKKREKSLSNKVHPTGGKTVQIKNWLRD